MTLTFIGWEMERGIEDGWMNEMNGWKERASKSDGWVNE
jgi:hypothetical protein